MRIQELVVENFKSLHHIEFKPRDLTVIIGANGSGKTNIASAFDFLSQVYGSGLQYAVMSKGGFENIAYRKQRRTKSAIRFKLTVELDQTESRNYTRFLPAIKKQAPGIIYRFTHEFAIKAPQQSISSEFSVVEEKLCIEYRYSRQSAKSTEFNRAIHLHHADNKTDYTIEDDAPIDKKSFKEYTELIFRSFGSDPANSLELFLRRWFLRGVKGLDQMAVYQFSPQISRTDAAPTPIPKLSTHGEHLVSLVDWLQRKHKERWKTVEESMRAIVPTLESIKVDITSNKLLTLLFKEVGSSRPWSAHDVSDGTIQSLAILCALADPRTALLFMEEPENSVHPWIVRQLAEQFRKHSKFTQTILTTHSPIILNVSLPEDIWICYRDGESYLSSLKELNPDVVEDWAKGEYRLFDLFDMGLVMEAMPKGQM